MHRVKGYNFAKRASESAPESPAPRKKLKKELKKVLSPSNPQEEWNKILYATEKKRVEKRKPPSTSQVDWSKVLKDIDVFKEIGEQRKQKVPRDKEPAEDDRKRRNLVIIPSKPWKPKDGVCSRCNNAVEPARMTTCLSCYRLAYCGQVCRKKQEGRFCSQICEEEMMDPSNDAEDSPPDNESPSRSISPESSHLDNLTLYLDNDDNDDENTDTIATVTDIEMQEIWHLAKEDLEAQKLALATFERRKHLTHLLTTEIPSLRIIDSKLADRGRTLLYAVLNTSTQTFGGEPSVQWIRAVDLQGEAWTAKMRDFFYGHPVSAARRRRLENPFGDDVREPGPFSRCILRMKLVEERVVLFNVREFERGPARGRRSEDYWFGAVELGPQ